MTTLIQSVPSEDRSDASSANYPIFEDGGSESGLSGQPPQLQQPQPQQLPSQPIPLRNTLSFELPSDVSGDHNSSQYDELRPVLPLTLSPPNAGGGTSSMVGEMIHIRPSSPSLPAQERFPSTPPPPPPPSPSNKLSRIGRWMKGGSSRRQRHDQRNDARPSAVQQRHETFATDEWEAAPRSPLQQSKARAWLSANRRTSRRHTTSPSDNATTTTTTTSGSGTTASRVVARILSDQRHRDAAASRHTQRMWYTLLEGDDDSSPRTAEAVAAALQLGPAGESVLATLRGRAGAVVWHEDDEGHGGQAFPHDDDKVPYLHIQDNLWVPHFEEYVVRKVDAFGRYLTSSTPSVAQGDGNVPSHSGTAAMKSGSRMDQVKHPKTTSLEWKESVTTTRARLESFHQKDSPSSEIEEWIKSPLEGQFDMALQSLSSSLVENESLSKDQVLIVRTVLRFLLVTLGVPKSHRSILQDKLCQPHFLDHFGKIVANSSQDTKSSVMACRLLTNIVTENESTSRIVLKHFEWQPPASEWRKHLSTMDTHSDSNQRNWLEMLLATASTSRDALAALVACWYNGLRAKQETPNNSLEKEMVHASLIVSNLLRNVLPSTVVLSSQKGESSVSAQDDATEWISLLICHLNQKVLLASLYASATGQPSSSTRSTDDTANASVSHSIAPEQVVLLQVLLTGLEGNNTDDAISCLGTNAESQERDVDFLAHELYPGIRKLLYPARNSKANTNSNDGNETNQSLGPTTLSLIREILAEVIVHDSLPSKHLREFLSGGRKLGATLLEDLSYHYDTVQARFQGRPAKDVILTEEEKRIFVSIVRLLGNMCHLCRSGQDHLRETLVPPAGAADDDGTADKRTGLHLLLSCTSLSHTCFTLREWSIVAIRNALQDNVENQALVAELQAQQPAPSAPLEEMGVRMQLEKNGKVSLTPIQEHN